MSGLKAAGNPAPVAVVTGASRGIGQAVASALLADGWEVIGTSRRGDGSLTPLDVADGESRSRFVNGLDGPLDAVISNAGISALMAAEDTPFKVVEELFATNVIGPIELLRLLLPRLRASGGRIVTVGSLVADYPVPLQSLYAATKAALRAYTLALREELRPLDVRVTHLEPVDVATAISPATGEPSDPYRRAYVSVASAREREMAGAPPPTKVAAAVVRLLRSRRPPAIAAAGGAAPLLRHVRRLLPDRLAGRLTARRYGL